MRTNTDNVAKCFVNGIQQSENHNTTLWHVNDKELYSYQTIIAQKIGRNKYLFNATRYGNTTSKHQCAFEYYARHVKKAKLIYLYHIPMGTHDLGYKARKLGLI